MKKGIALLLTLAISMTVVGCSSTSTKKDDKIVVWTQASPDHPEGKMFASRIAAYNETNPDKIPVEIQNFTRAGSGSGYIDKLNAAITSNQVPDIFTLDGPDVASYVEAGVVGDLDGLISDDFKNGFTDAMLEQGTVDGKLYALGYQDSGVMVMYNEDVINELPENIKSLIPTADKDWTWADFYKVTEAINALRTNPETKDKEAIKKLELVVDFLTSDITKGAYEIGMYYLLPMIWSNGGQVVAEDGLTVEGHLNSPQTLSAVTQFASFFAKDYSIAIEPEKSFHNGKSAMAVAGFWYISDLTTNFPSLKFRSVRYPKMDLNNTSNYTPSGSWAFVRSGSLDKGSEKAKQVGDVMAWLTNDEAAVEYYKANGAIPGRKNSVSAIDTNTDNTYHNEAWSVLKYQVENTNKARPISIGYPYLSETFARDIILKIAQNKVSDEATIKQYADEAIKKINYEFEKYKK